MLSRYPGATRARSKLGPVTMLAKLFQRLTADPMSEMAPFDWATRTARRRDWYVEGAVPDTIDGRFAMLSTIGALLLVRLEQLGDEGQRLSVAFTERFAEVMESEHRQLGLGDPTLGKTVLKLVGALGRRVELWRDAADWDQAARQSLPASDDDAAIGYRTARLGEVRDSLNRATLEQLAEGEVR